MDVGLWVGMAALAMSMVNLFILVKVTQVIDARWPTKRRLPNKVIAMLEDLQALDTDALLWLRDSLEVVESRLETRMDLVGQIRNGDYLKDQPARRAKVRHHD